MNVKFDVMPITSAAGAATLGRVDRVEISAFGEQALDDPKFFVGTIQQSSHFLMSPRTQPCVGWNPLCRSNLMHSKKDYVFVVVASGEPFGKKKTN